MKNKKHITRPMYDGYKCVLCGAYPNDIWGHNAEPVAEGICCFWCNLYEVIPARFEGLKRAFSSNKEIDISLDSCSECYKDEDELDEGIKLLTSDDDEEIISVDKVCEDCLPEYKRTYIIQDDDDDDKELLSTCCGASALGNIHEFDGEHFGLCGNSKCKEHTDFKPLEDS